MKQQILKVKENLKLNDSVYKMTLSGFDLNMKAGQFVELKIGDFYLRRPISVCACNSHTLTLVYKVVGEGTKSLCQAKVGDNLDVLTHLGNGFDTSNSKTPLLIGGGIGSAPLFQLALDFNLRGIKPNIILGFRSKDEVFFEKEFGEVGNLIIVTDDGSYGIKGNAVSVLKEISTLKAISALKDISAFEKEDFAFDSYFACGPMIMLKYLAEYNNNGQLSLEARMGCGFGACMGCSIVTTDGFKRVCKEGPVFDAKTIIFD